MQITITRNMNGSITLSTIENNQYLHFTFYDYSAYEAIKLFKEYVIEELSKNIEAIEQ